MTRTLSSLLTIIIIIWIQHFFNKHEIDKSSSRKIKVSHVFISIEMLLQTINMAKMSSKIILVIIFPDNSVVNVPKHTHAHIIYCFQSCP